MNEIEKALLFGTITFVIIASLYYFFFLKKKFDEYNGKVKKKKKKNKTDALDIMELTYLINKFKLDKDKINVLYCFKRIAIIDAFIIALTGTVIYYIPGKIIWKYLIGFAMLFALIYAIYELFGRHLVKKGWSKNANK